MGIRDKSTYGDYFWAMQVEAAMLEQETYEKELAPYVAGIFADLPFIDKLPPGFQTLLNQLQDPTEQATAAVLMRFASEIGDHLVSQLADPATRVAAYASEAWFLSKKLGPAQAATLFSRRKITEDAYLQRIEWGGFEPIESRFLYDSMRPYPSIPDLVLWSRYHGQPDNVWGTIQEKFDIDPVDFPIWEWLGKQRLNSDHVQRLYKRGYMTESDLLNELSRIGWYGPDVAAIRELGWLIPNAMLLVQGNLQQEQSPDKILADISRADIHPDYAQQYLDAVLTKPASQDIVAYELRQDASLSNLEPRLRKIGIHPEYTEVYRELAYQIPPVADIITMAVREAFTPEIAARFGQYQDFPDELAVWGEKKGLSKEWTERYWAAHWALPSPQQGFEMLHRGVINQDELNMLLRAQDVMPFWRDKLIAIAYRPLTRVDVRRMFKEGVLDEGGVFKAYLDAGYSDTNAGKMTEFTIRQTLSSMSKFTSSNVVSAYSKSMITHEEARSLLSMLNIRHTDIAYILKTAAYKKQWALTDTKIDAIRNLYKKGRYDTNKTRGELLKLDIATPEVEALMSTWWYEDKAERTTTFTKAETLRFYKAGSLTETQATNELVQMGYDDWHIGIYLGSVK